MPEAPVAGDAATLERLWHATIPLAAAMELKIVGFAGETLTTAAPAPPNRNLHGTAFAGSLYAICALTGWGFIWRLGHRLGTAGDIVLSRGEIDYRRPVTGTIECTASVPAEARDRFRDMLAAGRSGRCPVDCVIGDPADPAVVFSGLYHMRPAHCAPRPA